MNMPGTNEQVDFFISYNHADCFWAAGIADWLKEQQYTTVLQSQDIVAGSNFVSEMNSALSRAKRIIAVISPDYFTSPFPESEWTSAFVRDPTGSKKVLLLVRVRECDIPPLLKPRVYIDLVGKGVEAARDLFLADIKATLTNARHPQPRRAPKGNSIPFPRTNHPPIHQEIHGDRNLQFVNMFAAPHVIKKVIERREGSISAAECRQVHTWIEDLAEGTTGITRPHAYGMWWNRFKSNFGVEKYEELPSSRMSEAGEWYRMQKAMQTRGLKSKAPDAWRRKRITAIKAAMGEMNVSKQDYYPDVARRLRMKKGFASLKDLTKQDLDRVYTMASSGLYCMLRVSVVTTGSCHAANVFRLSSTSVGSWLPGARVSVPLINPTTTRLSTRASTAHCRLRRRVTPSKSNKNPTRIVRRRRSHHPTAPRHPTP